MTIDKDCRDCPIKGVPECQDCPVKGIECDRCVGTNITFNFPATIFSQANTPEQQIHHIRTELDEACYEIVFDNIPLAIMECLDAVHSAETLLRIVLREYGEEKVLKGMKLVIKKNHDRGYYLESNSTV